MDRMTSLAVFTAAVEGGSVAAAARRHKITPAMAGRHIDSLEEALKARLLQRTTRQLHLTDVGRAYYQRSRRILEEFEEAQREAGELQVSPQGTLRITVSACFAALHMGGPIARYMREHPGIRVEMLASDNFVDLVHEGIDMAVRIGRLADSNLVARHIGTCRMVMCAAPSYLKRVGEPKTPSDLRKHPRLAFSEAVSPGTGRCMTRAVGRTSSTDPAGCCPIVCSCSWPWRSRKAVSFMGRASSSARRYSKENSCRSFPSMQPATWAFTPSCRHRATSRRRCAT